jgi:hypothetical protein
MTISRKLLLIATLGMATQNCVQAYDVVGLKDEVKIIENHIKYGSSYGYVSATDWKNIQTWLKHTIYSTYLTTSKEIITIANAIKNDDKQALVNMHNEYYHFISSLTTGVGCLYAGLFCAYIIDSYLRQRENKLASNIIDYINNRNTTIDNFNKNKLAQNSQQTKSAKAFYDNIFTKCAD